MRAKSSWASKRTNWDGSDVVAAASINCPKPLPESSSLPDVHVLKKVTYEVGHVARTNPFWARGLDR